jgi:hypothetical protein
LVAEKLGFLSHGDAVARLQRTVRTLETMERHQPSGQFFNWYGHTTGQVLTVWPPSGAPLTPILSSVDNGWRPPSTSCATACPSYRRAPVHSSTRWILASTIGPRSIASCFITRRAPAQRHAVTTPL